MRCHKPGTDQECNLSIHVNGHPATEYVLPHEASFTDRDCDFLKCFVQVSHGDEITIHGAFQGTVLHGSFDLLVDGSYVGDKRIEGNKSGEVKYHSRRRLDFVQVLNVPWPEGWTSIYEPKNIVEGSLVVKDLSYEDDLAEQAIDQMGSTAASLGVGSIIVRIHLNQRSEEGYEEPYDDMHLERWRYRESAANDGGIRPTHELTVQPNGDIVHTNRQSRHRRHFKATRFGRKPWATFMFHYRSKGAIQQAGCLVRADQPQALVSDDDDGFINVDPGSKKKARRVRIMSLSNAPSVGDEGSRSPEVGQTPYPPPVQQPKKKLFGHSLGLSKQTAAASTVRTMSPDTLFVSQGPTEQDMSPEYESTEDEDDETPTPAMHSRSNRRWSDRGTSSTSRDRGGQDEQWDAPTFDAPSETMQDRSNSPANEDAIPEQLDGSGAALPTDEQLIHDAIFGNVQDQSGSPVTITRERVNVPAGTRDLSHDEVRSLADSDGMIPFRLLARYCDENRVNQDIGIRRCQEVAFKSGSAFVLKQMPSTHRQPIRGQSAAISEGRSEVVDQPASRITGQDESNMSNEQPAVRSEQDPPINPDVLQSASDLHTVAPSDMQPAANIEAANARQDSTADTSDPEVTAAVTTSPTAIASIEVPSPATATMVASPAASLLASSLLKRTSSALSPGISREGTPSKKVKSNVQVKEERLAQLKAAHEAKRQQKIAAQKAIEQLEAEKARRAAEEAEEERRKDEQLAKEVEQYEKMLEDEDEELEALERKRQALEAEDEMDEY